MKPTLESRINPADKTIQFGDLKGWKNEPCGKAPSGDAFPAKSSSFPDIYIYRKETSGLFLETNPLCLEIDTETKPASPLAILGPNRKRTGNKTGNEDHPFTEPF